MTRQLKACQLTGRQHWRHRSDSQNPQSTSQRDSKLLLLWQFEFSNFLEWKDYDGNIRDNVGDLKSIVKGDQVDTVALFKWVPGLVDGSTHKDAGEGDRDTPSDRDDHDCIDCAVEELAAEEASVLDEDGELVESDTERIENGATILDLEKSDQISGTDSTDVTSHAKIKNWW